MAKKVLVTGFQPFLEFKTNPSDSIAKAVDGAEDGKICYYGRTLPVAYDETESALMRCIDEVSPDLILGTGLAAGRTKLSLEKIAVNYKYSNEPDNNGNLARGEKIDPELPDGIFSRLNVEALYDSLNGKGIPAEISMSAGAYLCNYAMFVIVREAEKRGIKGGFIHIPCDTSLSVAFKQKSFPSMDLGTMIAGIKHIAMEEI